MKTAALKVSDLVELNKTRAKKDLLVLEHLDQNLSLNLKNDFTDEGIAAKPRVQVFVNLTRTKKGDTHAVFSVKDKKNGGKVALHAYYIELENCIFRVSEKTRQSVIDQDKRYVHAWVEGDLVSFSQVPCSVKGDFDAIASYNPFKGPDFYDVRTGVSVPDEADTVHMFGRCAYTRSR